MARTDRPQGGARPGDLSDPHASGRPGARTDPDAENPRLRGRTYGIPFDRVWNETLGLIAGHPRWSLDRADDEKGVVDATARTLLFRLVDDVRITITLDENGQTRVDLRSTSRRGRIDFGTNARRIGRFLRNLDRALE